MDKSNSLGTQKVYVWCTRSSSTPAILREDINRQIRSLESDGWEIVSIQVTSGAVLIGWITYRKAQNDGSN